MTITVTLLATASGVTTATTASFPYSANKLYLLCGYGRRGSGDPATSITWTGPAATFIGGASVTPSGTANMGIQGIIPSSGGSATATTTIASGQNAKVAMVEVDGIDYTRSVSALVRQAGATSIWSPAALTSSALFGMGGTFTSGATDTWTGATNLFNLYDGTGGGWLLDERHDGTTTDFAISGTNPFALRLEIDGAPIPNLPATPSGVGQKVGLGIDSGIGWEIDGRPVRMLGDWQAEVATNWGERTFTGTVSKDVTWVDQGSTITGWRRSGEPIWQGQVVAEPWIDGERLQIRGEGFARMLAENRTRMFYRIDGFAGWSDKEEDPYNGTNNDKYDLTQRPGLLRWRLDPSDAFVTNDQGGFATWVEGGEITKYSFSVVTGASYGAFDLEYQRFTGPQGTKSTVNTHTLNPVSSPITGTMTNPEDAAVLRIIANTNAAAGTRRVITVQSGKIYGRTNDDNFSLSDVCIDVGRESGFGTDGVESNPLLILPLDWTEPHPGLLDYMTELADWLWMIRGQELIVKPYGRIWETATDVGAKPQLEPEPQANRFVQPYRTISGALRKSVATAQTDPFPGEEITVWGEELEDPQANSDLPDAVAAAAVEYESTFRASGSVELTEVRFQGTVRLPYDVDAGDQLQLTDLAPKLGPQRIEAITYRPNNHATATVGQAFDLVRTLAENERPARRRRRKRKKPGGKP